MFRESPTMEKTHVSLLCTSSILAMTRMTVCCLLAADQTLLMLSKSVRASYISYL